MTEKPGTRDRKHVRDVARFDFEDDEVFRIAVEVAVLGDEIAEGVRADRPWAARQIGRSSLSVATNVGEAQGEHSPGDKARFYRYARRSATEAGATAAVLGERGWINPEQEARIRQVLVSVTGALTRRIIYFEGLARARKRGWLERKY